MAEISVPLQLRRNERRQLTEEFLPFILADLENIDSDNEEHVSSAMETILENESDTCSLPTEEWKAVVTELRRAERAHGLRPNYLRRKLFRRLQRRIEELEGAA